MTTPLVIGLSAVVVAIQEGEPAVLTVRRPDLPGLPFGPFEPEGQRTFELAMRAFVAEQTGFELGYVEQLYTFGDKGRDAPLADVGAGAARVVSVGYLAITPRAETAQAPDTAWAPWTRFFPWEDWREGRPPLVDEVIRPALEAWVRAAQASAADALRARVRLLFALDDGAPWNEERVLERYELLYEAGLVAEAARDRAMASGGRATGAAPDLPLGQPMISDHRRILATALSRLRGKLKYRPVVFELMPPEFTLSALQRVVEAIAGVRLHKQNFRRAVERSGLVEGLGRLDPGTGGRPAELFRFRRELLSARPVGGLPLPVGSREA
jgi:hypothetical protein